MVNNFDHDSNITVIFEIFIVEAIKNNNFQSNIF